MAFVPFAFWNSRSITHLANYLSRSLPMNSSDESHFLPMLGDILHVYRLDGFPETRRDGHSANLFSKGLYSTSVWRRLHRVAVTQSQDSFSLFVDGKAL